MPTPAVVEDLEVLEDHPPGRLAGGEGRAVDELVLQAAEEALHGRVVVAVTLAAHGLDEPMPGQDRPVGLARVLGGFRWSSQRLSALIAAPHQALRLAFSSRASCAASR